MATATVTEATTKADPATALADAASYLDVASNTLAQLEALFGAITHAAQAGTNIITVQHLVELGQYVACDLANTVDCWAAEIHAAEAVQDAPHSIW